MTETVTCPRPQRNATRDVRPRDQSRARATAAIGTQWSGAKECIDPTVIAAMANDAKRLVLLMRMLGLMMMVMMAPFRGVGFRRPSRLEPCKPCVDSFSCLRRDL
jgi:hypothetical protein